jgi:hypothetical protein
MKSFHNAATVQVTSGRDHFTQHGLHLNRQGKEQAAKTIASSIKGIFKLQKDPTKMSWKEEEKANAIDSNTSGSKGSGSQKLHSAFNTPNFDEGTVAQPQIAKRQRRNQH